MYLIYFYSNITGDVIPKKTISDINHINETIKKDIYDMVVFEEGKRKADTLSIFTEKEKILFNGLDDGLYVKQEGNKYNLYKKISDTVIKSGWLTHYTERNFENKFIGFFSYLEIPNTEVTNTEVTNTIQSNIIKIPIKSIPKEVKQIVKNEVKLGGFEGVLNELKNKFKNA
jgi:hypothetical protein